MAKEPSLFLTIHVHPEPKTLKAVAEKPFFRSSKEPKCFSINFSKSPEGSPPLFGDIVSQKKLWFQYPPPLFLTAIFTGSDKPFRLENKSNNLIAVSGFPSTAVFNLAK